MPADPDDSTVEGDPAVDAPLPADEQALLDAFARLAPEGSLRWHFDDAMRRLSTPSERAGYIEPWDGLPADLWDRGRGAKASERVLGDVITSVAQEMTEYAQRIVDTARRGAPEEVAVFDAFRYLAARVDRLESVADPLGLRPGELVLPSVDGGEWADELVSWTGATAGSTVVVGELDDPVVVEVLRAQGIGVDAVDPRAATVWAQDVGRPTAGRDGSVDGAAIEEVGDHLAALGPGSRTAMVLSGTVDRLSLADKVGLVDDALRVLAPGGALVLLVHDQSAWDAAIDPPVRDLLPGRPLHPDSWSVVLSHRGFSSPVVHRATSGAVHGIVARRPG